MEYDVSPAANAAVAPDGATSGVGAFEPVPDAPTDSSQGVTNS